MREKLEQVVQFVSELYGEPEIQHYKMQHTYSYGSRTPRGRRRNDGGWSTILSQIPCTEEEYLKEKPLSDTKRIACFMGTETDRSAYFTYHVTLKNKDAYPRIIADFLTSAVEELSNHPQDGDR